MNSRAARVIAARPIAPPLIVSEALGAKNYATAAGFWLRQAAT
jgi:hypothetical protein